MAGPNGVRRAASVQNEDLRSCGHATAAPIKRSTGISKRDKPFQAAASTGAGVAEAAARSASSPAFVRRSAGLCKRNTLDQSAASTRAVAAAPAARVGARTPFTQQRCCAMF